MTDVTLPVAAGRSLWVDAWLRLRRNRAAVASAVYLVLMALVCILGPNFTGHLYTTIYEDYVRVPPSLSPYPEPGQVEPALRDALKRARLDLKSWRLENGRAIIEVTAPRPIDDRLIRYLDRSSTFEDTRIEAKAPDGLSMTMSSRVERLRFLFGTDNTGRDLLTRTLVAGRVSLAIGLLAGLVAVVIGVLYGAFSGFVGGRTDEVMMRIVDVLYSLPFIFLVIVLVVFFGRDFVLMFLAVGAVLWLDMARIVRGQTLSIKRQEYVESARALGVSTAGILWRHVVPNTLGTVAIYMTLLVPQVIILESFLSYLGLGVQEPMTSWGVLIAQGAKNIPSANWLLVFPSLFLTTTLFALNFLGDGLRDAFDPEGPLMAEDAILALDRLDVRFATPDGEVHAVREVSLSLAAGETIAIVGESGSGKSQAMMAAMGLLARNGRAAGSVRYRGEEILGLPPRTLNRIRGAKISMIFQEPMTSLDPLYRIGDQIAEPLIEHQKLTRAGARPRVLELLDLVGIAEPERRLRSYPHQLSGGQRQRVMIAMALANHPDILIADEPTTALDVTIEAQIVALLADLQKRLGMAIVFITHNLRLVRRLAHRVYVMRAGEIVESGVTAEIFDRPQHPYTRMLLAAEPEGRKPAPADAAPILLEGRKVSVTFTLGGGLFAGPGFALHAVDRVDLALHRGQTIGIVGESGSGKSTLGRALLRLVDSTGDLRFAGRDIRALPPAGLRALRSHLQVVFQDPFGSLSPRMTVGDIVTEGLRVHEPGASAAERDRRAVAALADVQLDPATRNRYPHEFSGGQRQRIAIARAIILKPQVVVLDEPTSALDRSVQKQIVELLRRLQEEHGLSYLFISHDLAVVRAMADWVMVMRAGRVVEAGPTETIFRSPREEYTRALLAAALAGETRASMA